MATSTTPHARSSLRRTACDRCRHSKLRCYRDDSQQKCARCLRLELRCEVAPAKRSGRPRKVVSPPTPVDKSAAGHVDRPSPQLTEQDYSSPEFPNGEPLVQSPEDDHHQVNAISGQMSSPSHSNVNGRILTSAAPIPDVRIPEWYEMSCFDAGLPPIPDPLDLFTARPDRNECIKELSQLNVDLHAQCQALRDLADADGIKFSTFVDHPPPPAGDGISLAEKLLLVSQRFQQAVTNLSWVVKSDPGPPPSATAPGVAIIDGDHFSVDPTRGISSGGGPSPASAEQASGCGSEYAAARGHDPLLDTPFAFLLVSCYVQTIRLWEITYFHVHRRILGVDPERRMLSDPGKGVQLGAFYTISSRLKSVFFSQAVLYFLESIDGGLGILPEQMAQGVPGLLSHPQHFGLLQGELGGRVSEGVNERVRALRDSVERARICSLQDVGW
ncbi:hypothetical protein GGR53DRAFT_178638 [Hypoxylon sp. FL1150]|nr:hypothetical protein GGR53DRAFT_178638 [Hypoxylon sp. FL1150]